MKMIVIADDFTGAADTGVQLAKKGASVEVLFGRGQKPSRRADVLVFNTESRAMRASEAAAAVSAALAVWYDSPLVYKKIDSTLRGNLGAEIEAAMRAGRRSFAIIAPAIPSLGRTTRDGLCLVNGVMLLETEFATDPKTPITASRIATLIGLQSQLPVYQIPLEQVRGGKLSALLARYAVQGEGMAVVDALCDSDLALIARAACQQQEIPLLVGAAGLANALPRHCFLQQPQQLPVLVVAGSMSEVARRQVEEALRLAHVSVVDIDVSRLLSRAPEQEEIVRQACEFLATGHHCILRTSRSAADRRNIAALCQQLGLTAGKIGAAVSQYLGTITLKITQQTRIGGLILTGGDIAGAVAQTLGARGYRIQQEVASCIPCGVFINSEIDDLPVITKAGGFGAERSLIDALYFIEEMYCGH